MPDLAALQAAHNTARTQLDAYVAEAEGRHRELHPDPAGPAGAPRWNEAQALLRTAAWTDEENAELDRLRAAKDAAFMAMYRARTAAAGDANS